ncbi:putative peptide/nitrate transporter [Platanthera guangdongensis]|uniref:Peptide/nitrate transporter n=1 Tax=Platanthera guangdongensis TaxID=2320717 RepID=A0ABR2LYB4_9ASPA
MARICQEQHPLLTVITAPLIFSSFFKNASFSSFQSFHTRCLDKASILASSDEVQPEDGKPINPWRLCSSQHVEEVKCIIRILPIWSTGVLYNMAMTQQGTYVVFQALQSDCRLGNNGFQIPAGSFTVFNMLALTIWIPIYDRIVVPRLQRITKIEGGLTLLQRMGIGIVVAVVSLLVAAFVEEKRRSIALREFTVLSGRSEVSPMSGLWLIPQLMLCGLSEAFGIIGQIEFYYKQFPENMRSVAGAFLFLGLALSNYFCSLVVMAVHRTTGNGRGENWLAGDLNRGRLDLFYLLTAAMAVVNLAYFIVCARWYKYKDLKAAATAAAAEEIPMEVVKNSKE